MLNVESLTHHRCPEDSALVFTTCLPLHLNVSLVSVNEKCLSGLLRLLSFSFSLMVRVGPKQPQAMFQDKVLCQLNQKPSAGRNVNSNKNISHTIIANPSLHFDTHPSVRRWACPSELLLFQGFPIMPSLTNPGEMRSSSLRFFAANSGQRLIGCPVSMVP
jgi:hypothetical protein